MSYTQSRASSLPRSEHSLPSSPEAHRSMPNSSRPNTTPGNKHSELPPPSSPVSTLSSLSSDDFAEEEPEAEDGALSAASDGEAAATTAIVLKTTARNTAQPPSKRRRINAPNSASQAAVNEPITPLARVGPGALMYDESAGMVVDNETDVSSDTTGSVPSSPALHSSTLALAASTGIGKDGLTTDTKRAGSPDEETLGAEQIRACHWDGCDVGNLGDQDSLVRHINEQHVGIAKKSRYTCEWNDCKAKGKTQMSAYALRAHMRSHTKEKPFYCSLPECDRSFTRSDALSKHMRTVHETESVKTLDQYPKPTANTRVPVMGTTPEPVDPPPPTKKLKLVFGSSKATTNGTANNVDGVETSESSNKEMPIINNANGLGSQSPGPSLEKDELLGTFEPSLQFTDAETAMPRRELFRLLRRQIHWAEQESRMLQTEIEHFESLRRREWLNKELVLENVMEADFARAESKGVFGAVEGGPHGLKDAIFGSLDTQIIVTPEAFAIPAITPYDAEEPATETGLAIREAGDTKEALGDSKQQKRQLSEDEDRVLIGRKDAQRVLERMETDVCFATKLPMEGSNRPWYRDAAQRAQRKANIKSVLEHKKTARATTTAADSSAKATEAEGDDENEAAMNNTRLQSSRLTLTSKHYSGDNGSTGTVDPDGAGSAGTPQRNGIGNDRIRRKSKKGDAEVEGGSMLLDSYEAAAGVTATSIPTIPATRACIGKVGAKQANADEEHGDTDLDTRSEEGSNHHHRSLNRDNKRTGKKSKKQATETFAAATTPNTTSSIKIRTPRSGAATTAATTSGPQPRSKSALGDTEDADFKQTTRQDNIDANAGDDTEVDEDIS